MTLFICQYLGGPLISTSSVDFTRDCTRAVAIGLDDHPARGSKNTFPTLIHIWDVASAQIGREGRKSTLLQWKVVTAFIMNSTML